MEFEPRGVVVDVVRSCIFHRPFAVGDGFAEQREGTPGAVLGSLATHVRREGPRSPPRLPQATGDRCLQSGSSSGAKSRRTVRPPAAYVFSDWSERRQWWNRGGRWRTSSTLAIPSRATLGFVQLRVHRVGGLERRIQAHRSGRGSAKMGRKKEQTEHELRQTLASTQILLRQKYYDQGSWKALRLQIRFPWINDSVPGASWSVPGAACRLTRARDRLSSASLSSPSSSLRAWTDVLAASDHSAAAWTSATAALLLAISAILAADLAGDCLSTRLRMTNDKF